MASLLFLGEVRAEGWLVAFTPGARRGTAGKLAGKVGACSEIAEGHVPTGHGPLGSGVLASSDATQCFPAGLSLCWAPAALHAAQPR